MNCYENLANAIIVQAVKDYKYGDNRLVIECEQFFHSDWFRLLTNVDGDMLISKIKEECERERNSRTKHRQPDRNYF